MTDQDKISDSQRFTGAYSTSGTPGYGTMDTQKDWPGPLRQDTTFISPSTGTARTFLPGDIIDKTYQLRALLGRGGMGMVFACRHMTLDKEYALKLLSDGQLKEGAWLRFQAEAKALARLNHPGIVGIHNMGVEGGQYPYYVMDLLSGETLDVLVDRSGPLPINQALGFFIQVCDALSSAHLQGIIHRDIKPSNLMLVRDLQNRITRVKIVDFGIARLSKHEFAHQSQTATGLVFGTPYYMSPEQCQGLRVDERSDIYSLGCTLFEALTGSPPFQGENAFQTFMLHQTQTLPSLTSVAAGAQFPASLDLALEKMLSKRASNRYQTMLQVQHDLERIQSGKPIMAEGLVGAASLPKKTELPEAAVTGRLSAHQRDQGIEDNSPPVLKRALIAAGLLAIILSTVCFYLITNKPGASRARSAQGPVKASNDMKQTLAAVPNTLADATKKYSDSDALKTNGAGLTTDKSKANGSNEGDDAAYEKALKDTVDLPIDAIKLGVEALKPKLKAYVKESKLTGKRFKREGSTPGFQFIDDVSVGALRRDKQKPVLAMGFVPVAKNSEVCLYLETASSSSPDMLDLFGPNDLTGLQFVWPKPEEALSRAKSWKRLNELSLFNPLIKAPVGFERLDESPLDDNGLRQLSQFSGLRTLGLCGRNITVQAILDMPILPKLQKLELKSVRSIVSLLPKLAKLDNLKELWLVNEGITDDQLEPLTHMKNLARLRIIRSQLKPESVSFFRAMPALNHLQLDTSWTKQENEKFKSNLPKCLCEFEQSDDRSYWVLVKK